MTRPLFACLVTLLAAPIVSAAPAVTLAHSGRLLDASDQPVEGTVALGFRVYAGEVPTTGEQALWTDQREVTLKDGFYSLVLGLSAQGEQTLTADVFPAGETRWLAVSVGGVELSPRHRFGIVPSAAVALVAHDFDCVGCVKAEALAFDPTPADGSVTTAKLAEGAVTAQKLATGAVGEAALSGGAVTADKLATGAVGAQALAPEVVDTAHLVDGAVTRAKLAQGAVNGAQLASGAVGTAQLADGAVTGDKLAPGTIAAGKVEVDRLQATDVAGALGELASTRARLFEMPVGPNYLRDTKNFLGLGDEDAPDQWASSTGNVRDPWRVSNWEGRSYTLQIRRVAMSTYAKDGDPELGSPATLMAGVGNGSSEPTYYNFDILLLRVAYAHNFEGTERVVELAQEPCLRVGGAYFSSMPATTSAWVKVLDSGTGHETHFASNGWPSKVLTDKTPDWTEVVANGIHGGCLRPIRWYCRGSCSGTTTIAIALPHIGSASAAVTSGPAGRATGSFGTSSSAHASRAFTSARSSSRFTGLSSRAFGVFARKPRA